MIVPMSTYIDPGLETVTYSQEIQEKITDYNRLVVSIYDGQKVGGGERNDMISHNNETFLSHSSDNNYFAVHNLTGVDKGNLDSEVLDALGLEAAKLVQKNVEAGNDFLLASLYKAFEDYIPSLHEHVLLSAMMYPYPPKDSKEVRASWYSFYKAAYEHMLLNTDESQTDDFEELEELMNALSVYA
jgi:hypothetical protein